MKRFFKFIVTITMVLTVSTGYITSFADAASAPDIEGTGAIVYCATTDEVIWEKNSDKKYNLASITKLMTCLIAAEELGLDTIVTVDKEAANVTKSESIVYEGEEITVENLIYEALLESANDAAKALAIATSGSEEDFVKLMNQRADKIGCTKTKFVTSSGVYAEGHGASAKDIALIAAEVFKNEDIRKIAGTAEYTVPKTNKSESRVIQTTNLFLEGGEYELTDGTKITVEKYAGVFGGKTGTTNLNKATMVVGYDCDGLEIYVVTLNSTLEKRFSDIKNLLEYAKENVSRYEAFAAGTSFEKGKLLGGATNKVEGIAAEAGIINLPEGASASLVTAKAVYDEELKAPIEKGQVIGRIDIYMADEVVRSIEMTAAEDIKEGWFLSSFGITNFQTVLIIAVLVLIIAFTVMVMVMRSINKRKKAAARRAKLRRLAMQQMERDHDHRQRNWPY